MLRSKDIQNKYCNSFCLLIYAICFICRGYDFSKSGFGPRTVILCDQVLFMASLIDLNVESYTLNIVSFLQCEKEYHVGCLKKCKIADLKVCTSPEGSSYISFYYLFLHLLNPCTSAQKLPKGKWFCSTSCKWIYSALQNLLNAGAEEVPDCSLDVIKKKETEKILFGDSGFDVRWRLLNGKISSRETRVLLSQAVAIFHVRI